MRENLIEMNIDKLNWDILNLLQANARLSNAEIGRRVGLSSPAVAERIKKMEDLGVINSYRTEVSYTAAGYQLKAIITVRAFMGKLKPFLEKIREFREVINCYRITGNENIIMEVVFHDQKHLEGFIDKLITYGETRTHIVLSNVITHGPIPGKLG